MAEVSPHSAAEHLLPHQIQADPTINAAINRLDASVHGLLALALTGDDVTLTPDQVEQCGYIRITGAFSADRTLTLPDNNNAGTNPRAKFFTIEHAGSGGFSLTLTTVGGTGVTLAQNTTQAVFCDTENIVPVAPVTGSGGQPWDVHPYLPGLPGAAAIFYRTQIIRALRIPAGMTLSLGSSEVAATASAVFSFKKAGVEFATATFALGATVCTFTAASDTDFTAGQEFRIDAPASQDATLAGVQFSIAALKL